MTLHNNNNNQIRKRKRVTTMSWAVIHWTLSLLSLVMLVALVFCMPSIIVDGAEILDNPEDYDDYYNDVPYGENEMYDGHSYEELEPIMFDEWMGASLDMLKANAVLAAHGSTTRTAQASETQHRWKYNSTLTQTRRERNPRSYKNKLREDLLTLFGPHDGKELYDLFVSPDHHDFIVGYPSYTDQEVKYFASKRQSHLEMMIPPPAGYDDEGYPPPEDDEEGYGYDEEEFIMPSLNDQDNRIRAKLYIDKYVKQLLETVQDPDCMTNAGLVDVSASDYTPERAIQVFHKCHFLVLKNILSEDLVEDYRANVTQYMYDLKDGKVNHKGTTTMNERYYMYDVEYLRWDMLLPKKFAQNEEIMAHPKLMDVLKDERVLGEDQKCLAFGMVMAEQDANQQGWHADTPGLFHDFWALDVHGFAGHEIPTSEIVMFSPLMQHLTPIHGPTQFCVGVHYLNGLDWVNGLLGEDEGGWYKLLDESLRSQLIELGGGPDTFANFISEFCPPALWRSFDNLGAGDMVLWDYSTVHRAGLNLSKDFRTALYVSYARTFVKDTAFDGYRLGEHTFEETAQMKGRFAVIPSLTKDTESTGSSLSSPSGVGVNNVNDDNDKTTTCTSEDDKVCRATNTYKIKSTSLPPPLEQLHSFLSLSS